MTIGVILAPLGDNVADGLRPVQQEMQKDGIRVEWDDRIMRLEDKKAEWRDGPCSVALILGSESATVWSLEEGVYGSNRVSLEEAVDQIYVIAGIERSGWKPKIVRDPEDGALKWTMGGTPSAPEPDPEPEPEIESWALDDEGWRDRLTAQSVLRADLVASTGKFPAYRQFAVRAGDRIYLNAKIACADFGWISDGGNPDREFNKALIRGSLEYKGMAIGYADPRLEELRVAQAPSRPAPAKRPKPAPEPAGPEVATVAWIGRNPDGTLDLRGEFDMDVAREIVAFCREVGERTPRVSI